MQSPARKQFLLYAMVCLYVVAGISHFVHPQAFMSIMPPWLPWPAMLVLVSGICEVGFGLLLLPVATRRVGAWLIIALLVAVFPANVQMAVNYAHAQSPYLWIALLRLPLQGVLVWWAWQYTKRA